MGNYYLVINYLFTISQNSQTPSTTGQPSRISGSYKSLRDDPVGLGVVSICDVLGYTDKLHSGLFLGAV